VDPKASDTLIGKKSFKKSKKSFQNAWIALKKSLSLYIGIKRYKFKKKERV
jgi:hypothetical protein